MHWEAQLQRARCGLPLAALFILAFVAAPQLPVRAASLTVDVEQTSPFAAVSLLEPMDAPSPATFLKVRQDNVSAYGIVDAFDPRLVCLGTPYQHQMTLSMQYSNLSDSQGNVTRRWTSSMYRSVVNTSFGLVESLLQGVPLPHTVVSLQARHRGSPVFSIDILGPNPDTYPASKVCSRVRLRMGSRSFVLDANVDLCEKQHSIALTRDATSVQWYIDSKLVHSVSSSTPPPSDGSPDPSNVFAGLPIPQVPVSWDLVLWASNPAIVAYMPANTSRVNVAVSQFMYSDVSAAVEAQRRCRPTFGIALANSDHHRWTLATGPASMPVLCGETTARQAHSSYDPNQVLYSSKTSQLVLVATRDTPAQNSTYTAARISSKTLFDQGTVEMALQVPDEAPGVVSRISLTSHNTSEGPLDAHGSISLMIFSDARQEAVDVDWNALGLEYWLMVQYQVPGQPMATSIVRFNGDLAGKMHDYAIQWSASQLRIFVDARLVLALPVNGTPAWLSKAAVHLDVFVPRGPEWLGECLDCGRTFHVMPPTLSTAARNIHLRGAYFLYYPHSCASPDSMPTGKANNNDDERNEMFFRFVLLLTLSAGLLTTSLVRQCHYRRQQQLMHEAEARRMEERQRRRRQGIINDDDPPRRGPATINVLVPSMNGYEVSVVVLDNPEQHQQYVAQFQREQLRRARRAMRQGASRRAIDRLPTRVYKATSHAHAAHQQTIEMHRLDDDNESYEDLDLDLDTKETSSLLLHQDTAQGGGSSSSNAKKLAFDDADSIASGESEDNCLICLEPYEDGDVLRTLPCFHSFHAKCIDEWLQRKSICPECRWSAFDTDGNGQSSG